MPIAPSFYSILLDAYEPGDIRIRWRYLFFSIKNLDAYEPGDTRWRHTELWTMYIHRIHHI